MAFSTDSGYCCQFKSGYKWKMVKGRETDTGFFWEKLYKRYSDQDKVYSYQCGKNDELVFGESALGSGSYWIEDSAKLVRDFYPEKL